MRPYVSPTYRFTVDGREYTGTYFRCILNSDSYTEIAKELRPRIGGAMAVYYDPQDPTVSVLDRGPVPPGYFWKRAAPWIVVLGVCVFVLLGAVTRFVLKLIELARRIRSERAGDGDDALQSVRSNIPNEAGGMKSRHGPRDSRRVASDAVVNRATGCRLRPRSGSSQQHAAARRSIPHSGRWQPRAWLPFRLAASYSMFRCKRWLATSIRRARSISPARLTSAEAARVRS